MSDNASTGAAPVRQRLNQAFEEGGAQTVLKIGLRSVAEADDGNFCQCPEPEHVKPGGGRGDLMCGICGLRDQAAQARWEAEFRDHVFVLDADPLRREMGWCEVCTNKRDHPYHRDGDGRG